MALWMLSDAGQQVDGGRLTTSSLLTTVTAPTTANSLTGASWAQMIAATGFEATGLHLHLGQTGVASSTTNSQTLINVGVGASGAEQTVAANLAAGGNLPFASWYLPLVIPSGSRIALRIQSAIVSKSITAGVMVVGGGSGLEAGYRATTYGAVTGGSRGTILTAPASANTVEAAWTVIDAATAAPMRWMVVGLTSPNNAAATAINGFVDIGVGAAAAEAVVVSDIAFAISTNEDLNRHAPLTFPVNIPAGTRLVARYRGTSTSTAASPTVTVTGID